MTAGGGEGRESVECEGIAHCCFDINSHVCRTGLAEVKGAGCRDVEAQRAGCHDVEAQRLKTFLVATCTVARHVFARHSVNHHAHYRARVHLISTGLYNAD